VAGAATKIYVGITASVGDGSGEAGARLKVSCRDRVRSGLAVARAQGKRIGRPRRAVDAARVAELRGPGVVVG
jgi:hypothetical protein